MVVFLRTCVPPVIDVSDGRDGSEGRGLGSDEGSWGRERKSERIIADCVQTGRPDKYIGRWAASETKEGAKGRVGIAGLT